MKISKDRFESMKESASKALKRARESGQVKDAGDAAKVVLTGVAGGIASSMALGAVPLPFLSPDKSPMVKSLMQAGAGGFLMMNKNKLIKYAGAGMAILGAADLIKRLLPVSVPTMAGEADEMMYGYGDGRDLDMNEMAQLRGSRDADMMGARDTMMGARTSMAGEWDAGSWK